MYNFVDTTETPGALPLPAEAMSYGGVYIENEIEGYRTLYVEGRETITANIDVTETQTRHGASFRNMRYEPRTLTVGFQLISPTATAMMASYNKLLHILSQKQAQIIFNDEQDKYYTGTKTKITNTPPGRLAVTGEIEIYCADPFKYSVQEYEATAENGVITVDYGGTHPAHPILTAQSEDHDCGFYYFRDEDGHTIQAGDPIEEDQEEVPSDQAVEVTNAHFGANYSNPDWQRENARLVYGYFYDSIGFEAAPEYIYTNANTPVQYNYYYGAAMGYNFSEPMPGFTASVLHWFQPSGNQGGGFDFYINNQGGGNICGISIWRGKGGNVNWVMIVKGRSVKGGSYTLNNNPFKDAWRTQTITKSQGTLTFNLGGVSFTVTDPQLTDHSFDAANVSFILFRQPGADSIGSGNAIKNVYIRGIPNTWEEIANKIPQGGLVEIDTGNGDILLDGNAEPWLGTADNDFETFELEYGENAISCGASNWVDDAVYTMRYREVFL